MSIINLYVALIPQKKGPAVPMLGWCGYNRRDLETRLADATANGEIPAGAQIVRVPPRLALAVAVGEATCPCGTDSLAHGRLRSVIERWWRRGSARPARSGGGGYDYERNLSPCMGGDLP